VNEPAAAFNNLGVVYMEQKRWNEAKDVFKRAVLLDPTYKKAQSNLVEAEAHVPRPTVINLPAFKDSSVALAPKNVVSGKQTVTRAEAKASVTKRESRIATAYRDALDRFRQKHYQEAIDIFDWLLEQYPTDTLASNCQYWIGESYFGLQDYKKAYTAFKRVTEYTGSAKRVDALTMMRRSAYKQRIEDRTKGVS
jgi:TolA-binding protein